MVAELKALSDPTRLRLVGILANGEFTVQDLVSILEMGQSEDHGRCRALHRSAPGDLELFSAQRAEPIFSYDSAAGPGIDGQH